VLSRATLLKGLAVLTAATIAVPAAATAPANAGQRITPESFGVHSFTTDPGVPAGALRMNCWPTWRMMEPTKGDRTWGAMDATLNKVRSWGVSDVMFVFCGTPRWAAGPVADPSKELKPPLFGKGSTAAPKNMAFFRSFVTAFVKRYSATIDHYQAWNEITSPQFYQGTAGQMATMTKILSEVVRQYDPTATVVGGSIQTHVATWYRSMGRSYMKALRAIGWPIDAFAGHFYPLAKGGPAERNVQIKRFVKDLRKQKKPSRVQMWDTEANFYTSVPGNPPAGRLKGKKAATFLARNYLDSWALGLRRSYWYLWSSRYEAFAGIQMRKGDIATRTYRTLAGWTIGSTFKKCRTKGNLVKCSFTGGPGKATIAYTTSGKAALKVSGKKRACPVSGSKCKKAKRGKVTVTTLPVRIA
jgi:hypothetical protein